MPFHTSFIFEPSTQINALRKHLELFEQTPEVAALLILACDANGYTPANLNPLLHACTKPVLGGIFPQVLHEGKAWSEGVVVVGLSRAPVFVILDNLSQHSCFDEILDHSFNLPTSPDTQTLLVFVDGFATHISSLIEGLFNTFGLELNYLGGGCGSLSLQPKPCIITPTGLLQDSALLVFLDYPSGVGVAHGWDSISRPYKVTSAQGNIIHSLDWRPAFEVYQEILANHGGQHITPDNFFSIAKAYPFGITRLDAEMVVRDPLSTQNQHITCAGEVPTGAFVRVLHGNQHTLIQAAQRAHAMAHEAWCKSQSRPYELQFVVDCISRALFLEQDFRQELAVIHSPGPMLGALTIGEIANSGQDYLEFYNKTAVVGFF
ncbi:MAG: histidine kinase [Ferrovum myxofaciens]|uniref:FIST signal transduction protein n=1 Tax=Ferrovum myxofaciens TaxID=416213 RepID=UPI002356D7C7|nr:FIST C-terminal domain-containing protein [Ferrovum myxofaciens]QKE40128.1 MAG: histidine kinase [Ferrovum myxofaciens]